MDVHMACGESGQQGEPHLRGEGIGGFGLAKTAAHGVQ